MALIEWNDSLSVKVKEIDAQHQKLVDLINELHDAMIHRTAKEIVTETVNGLVTYTVSHFQTEELYFDKFGYPDAESHKKEHAEFVEKVSEFQKKLESGELFISVDVLNFLSDWLKNHINGSDKQYSELFNSKGLV